jgi:hypothetical protein
MSVSFGCKCGERKNRAKQRAWIVIARKCNYSAFNGYRYASSEYSDVLCLSCGACGRTKAGYVRRLQDGKVDTTLDQFNDWLAHGEGTTLLGFLSARSKGREAGNA